MSYKYKILVVVTEHFMGISICINTYVCTGLKIIGIHKEKEMSAKWGIHKWP